MTGSTDEGVDVGTTVGGCGSIRVDVGTTVGVCGSILAVQAARALIVISSKIVRLRMDFESMGSLHLLAIARYGGAAFLDHHAFPPRPGFKLPPMASLQWAVVSVRASQRFVPTVHERDHDALPLNLGLRDPDLAS